MLGIILRDYEDFLRFFFLKSRAERNEDGKSLGQFSFPLPLGKLNKHKNVLRLSGEWCVNINRYSERYKHSYAIKNDDDLVWLRAWVPWERHETRKNFENEEKRIKYEKFSRFGISSTLHILVFSAR